MASIWLYTILSVFIVSLISLIGIFTILLKEKFLRKILMVLVSFSAGGLLGGAFIHLIPEALEEYGIGINILLFVLVGIISFFILEKFIHWRHCHKGVCKVHTFTYMSLVGDAFHNLIDGAVIAGSYMLSIPLGITTTIAVILHEIPQELGDFGVLLHGGFSKVKAITFNFLSALTAIIGAIIILILGNNIGNISMFLLPFTAGGFIYIATSDLIPELHKETKISRSLIQFVAMIAGIGLMGLMLLIG